MKSSTGNPEEAKKAILEFLKKHSLAVLSTVDAEGRKPESAVLSFVEMDDLSIVFGTANTSRKYSNLQKNQNVALVIGWDGRVGTLQYEGVARELSKAESVPYAAAQIAKNPFSKAFADRDDQRYFLVTPAWMRLTDMSQKPAQTIELSF